MGRAVSNYEAATNNTHIVKIIKKQSEKKQSDKNKTKNSQNFIRNFNRKFTPSSETQQNQSAQMPPKPEREEKPKQKRFDKSQSVKRKSQPNQQRAKRTYT